MTNHYDEAERLLKQYRDAVEAGENLTQALLDNGTPHEEIRTLAHDLVAGSALILQEAQVHATLATVK